MAKNSIMSDMPPIMKDTDLPIEEKSTPGWDAQCFTEADDTWNFIEPEQPYSASADAEGLSDAEFILKNAKLVQDLETKRSELEKKTNCWADLVPHLDVRITYFKNWAKNLQISNGLMLYAKPETIGQVKNLIEAAKKLNIKVGCGGAYHSWTPLFPEKCSDLQTSLLINTRGLHLHNCYGIVTNKRIRVNIDEMTVTIVPGVTTGELMEVFLQKGICFESDVVLMSVTYGGIMTTGCHGVGKDQTALADWITQIKIVDHNGELRIFPDDIPKINKDGKLAHEDIMNAVKVSLGVMGVVVEMTIKVKKIVTARLETSYPQLGTLLYGERPQLLQLIRKHWSVEVMWFPFNSLGIVGGILEGIPKINIWQPKTDEVWVRAIDQDPYTYFEANRIEKLKQRISDTIQHKVLGLVGNPVMAHYGSLTPAIIGGGFEFVKRANPAGTSLEPMPFAIHFRYGISLAPVYDMEFAFPFTLTDDDDDYKCFENVITAMRLVVEKAKKYSMGGCLGFRKEFPLSTTMELRIIKKSDCLLCPATEREDGTTHTAYLEILSFGGTTNYQKFFEEVGEEWMKLGGVPHWCKQWTFLDGIIDHMQDFYGGNLDKFKNVLELISTDKNGRCEMFINSTMKRILKLN